jgi:hypothetical protein
MGQGFPPEVPWVVFDFPLFLVDSDLTSIRERIDEVVACLTTWEPVRKTIGTLKRDPVTVSGKDYPDAFQNVQQLFLINKWGDGTTINPPSRDQVDWILMGTDHDRGAPVGGDTGKIFPKGGILTYEVLATCLAMAGGRPEYLPVLDAACRSIVGHEVNMLTSSMSAYAGILVNGPIAKQIRLSSGFGLFGPDPVRPAGTVIGRALWFVLQNVGGLISGLGTIAQYGEMRHNCLCFAENEDGLPEGWTSYSEEYFDRPKGTNSATYFESRGGGVRGFAHRGRGDEPSFEVEMLESFHRAANVIKSVPVFEVPADSKGNHGMLLYPSMVCNNMAGIGWDKKSIKEHLAEELFYLKDEIAHRSGIQRALEKEEIDIAALAERFALYTDAQRIRLVVAGGDHPSRAMWIPNLANESNVEIELPASWETLLSEAEQDLGPAPMDY